MSRQVFCWNNKTLINMSQYLSIFTHNCTNQCVSSHNINIKHNVFIEESFREIDACNMNDELQYIFLYNANIRNLQFSIRSIGSLITYIQSSYYIHDTKTQMMQMRAIMVSINASVLWQLLVAEKQHNLHMLVNFWVRTGSSGSNEKKFLFDIGVTYFLCLCSVCIKYS